MGVINQCIHEAGRAVSPVEEELVDQIIAMTDGYNAYRHYGKRLRCWAHLIRKLKGLEESVNKEAQAFGQSGLTLFDLLIKAIRAARDGPNKDIIEKFSAILDEFKIFCLDHWNSDHEKTRKLAREFLNDWEAIWQVLSNVDFPMTNNEAERLLRHWVISRKISYGTRTDEGSKAFCLLASVIETCRLRKVSPWEYIAQVIAERRKNNPVPPLPQPAI